MHLGDHTYLFQDNGRFVCDWVTILMRFETKGCLCALGFHREREAKMHYGSYR